MTAKEKGVPGKTEFKTAFIDVRKILMELILQSLKVTLDLGFRAIAEDFVIQDFVKTRKRCHVPLFDATPSRLQLGDECLGCIIIAIDRCLPCWLRTFKASKISAR